MKKPPPDTTSFWQMTWWDDSRKKQCVNIPEHRRDKFIAKLAEWRITGRAGTVWHCRWQRFSENSGKWQKRWVDLSEYNLR